MRMLLKVSPRGEVGNKAVADGTMGRVLGQFMEKHKPEAAYFTVEHGERMAYMVFDLKDVAHLPAIMEPFWNDMGATVDYHPVMNGEDLQRGLAALKSH